MEKKKNRNKQQNKQENNSKSNTAVLSSEEKDSSVLPNNETQVLTSETEAEQPAQEVSDDKHEEGKTVQHEVVAGKVITDFSPENVKGIVINALKILLPVAACAIVIAVIISYVGSNRDTGIAEAALNIEEKSAETGSVMLSSDPLAQNVYTDVNELMTAFYTALADGDMDTVRALKDYSDETEIITYEKKSEFIESYDNINCYTKPGLEENSYFVYVSYDVKVKDIETKAPGLTAFYVYTADDGSLKIDGDREENITAAFKLVTSQDDVVDLYNKIDVSYKEAIASDEALNDFLTELPTKIKTSVGEALAKLETQNAQSADTQPVTETEAETQTVETDTANASEEPLQNQTVNQIVRATDTVNVRSSDSEEADKIGKVQTGTELTRVEERINGWSKVIYEEQEAYIKSDYLEVITTEAVTDPIGSVTAMTNVNVRSSASQDSDKLGTAQAGNSYDLLEDQGEWFKINYDGKTGFVKAEFFEQ